MKSEKKAGETVLIVKLIITALVGLAGHRAYVPSQMFGPRWGSMLRYALGLLLFIPCFIIVKRSLSDENPEPERDIISGLLTAGALGTGTLAGHFVDGLVEK